jgi:regulatory protein
MKPLNETEMLSRMAAYCSTAERCIQDVQKKIQPAGLSPEVNARIIATLVKEKFIDETRYARSFINDKLRFNKWGRIKIAYELNKKNIPPAISTKALRAIDETVYLSNLLTLLKEKKKTIRDKDGQEIFIKLLRFASGRGFENKEVIQCLRQLFKGNDYADDLP